MLEFRLEPELRLLTVTRNGVWSVDEALSYEEALRLELAALRLFEGPTACIIDVRLDEHQPLNCEGLRLMIGRLGKLAADRFATVTSADLTNAQIEQLTRARTRVFTSMVLARDWAARKSPTRPGLAAATHEPSHAWGDGLLVQVRGPGDIDFQLTPAAALETAKRISDAAIDVLLRVAAQPCDQTTRH
ncbi:hypothetical protein [Sphingomonas sp. 37zxx]|uniref:hypothetical protein n=1 Tax=Sphingomonas sp. 37zxx TaxID=1550073 RepID=UPI00053BFF26|nr:hypothetical protein [Sphingomonas sp. 37zxx]